MDIDKVYVVVTYDECIGIKLMFFTDKDKAEAYVEEFKSVLRGSTSCYSVKKHEVPVYPDDTWDSILERGDKLFIRKCSHKQWEEWCLEQKHKEKREECETKQNASPNKSINELAKKVLELYDVIDKQNDYIKKYQMALGMASVDIVKCIEEGLEGCSVCPERVFCEAHRHDMTLFDCGSVFLKSWKEKAG